MGPLILQQRGTGSAERRRWKNFAARTGFLPTEKKISLPARAKNPKKREEKDSSGKKEEENIRERESMFNKLKE